MSVSREWEKIYKSGGHNSVWPWSDLISLTHRYVKGNMEGIKVLELGCGAGANIPFFLSMGMKYYGIEGSRYQTEVLNKKFQNQDVLIAAGDFTKEIPFHEKFDLIIDRGSVTCNSAAGIKCTVDAVHKKLSGGGTFIGIDWFSDNHDEFKEKRGQAEFIEECTCIFHEGYFAGLGMIHFFNEEQIQCLLKNFKIMELCEKRVIQHMPGRSMCASWNFAAQI